MTANSAAVAPAWSEYVRPPARLSLSDVLVRPRGGLTLDGRRVSASIIDEYALRLVEHALASGVSLLVIHPPDPLHALCALAPAAAHVARVVERKLSGDDDRCCTSDRRIAVLTRDPRVPTLYRRLGVAGASLADVVPAMTASVAGRVWGFGNGAASLAASDGRGFTLFTRSRDRLRALGPLDLVVVDAPHPDLEAIVADDSTGPRPRGSASGENPHPPVVVLSRDPADYTVVRMARRGVPTFAWTAGDLQSLATVTAVRGPKLQSGLARLERLAAGGAAHVIGVDADAVAENGALFWSDVGGLVAAARGSPLARELVQQAFALYHELQNLVVPLGLYEAWSVPVAARIRAIDTAARLAEAGEARDLYLPSVGLELRDLAAALRPVPPKARMLEALLHELAGRADRPTIALLTRDAGGAALLEAAFADSPALRDGRLRIVPFAALPTAEPTDVAILTGMPPTWARHLYAAGIAAELFVLAYDAAGADAGGVLPTEANLARRTLAYRTAYAEWLARPSAKAACWEALSGETLDVPDPTPAPPVVAWVRDAHGGGAPVTPEVQGAAAGPPDAPPGLWDRVADLTTLEAALRSPLSGALPVGTVDGSRSQEHVDVVQATRLTFDDGRWSLVESDDAVTLLRDGAPLSGQRVQTLHAGDVLVAIDGRTCKEVLAKVLEVGATVPELAIGAAWLQPWRSALERARRSYPSYEAFARALRGEGCTLTTETIRLWVVGKTIGPDDPEDVRRVGVVFGEPTLTHHHRRVWNAMALMRNAHMRLLRRIADLARRVGSDAVAGRVTDDELIDERSGLTAGDFRDCVEFLPITDVAPVGAVPAALVGRIRAREEEVSP